MAPPGRLSAKAAERLFGEAVALHRDGRHAEALRRLRRLRDVFPDHPDVLHLTGMALLADDRPGDAVDPLRAAAARAEAVHPVALPGILNALGSALRRAERPEEAIPILRRATGLAPNDADAWFNLGNAQWDAGHYRETTASFEAAWRLNPKDPAIAYALGESLARAGDIGGARRAYEATIALDPGHARAHSSLGAILVEHAEMAPARAALERAIALDPDLVPAHVNLGTARVILGDIDGAIESTRRALALDSTLANAHSNLIQLMNYSDRYSADDLCAEARAWNARHAAPLAARARPLANAPEPERRLKVGYVGGDFRNHPVGWFMLALFANHDPARVEPFVYMTSPKTDAVSARIQAHGPRWRDAVALSESALAETIRADGIDILVDIASHTSENRLRTMAERPAPVQAVGFGLVCTTGAAAVDYILGDRFEIPPGHERFYSESVARLPHDYVCYTAPDYAPAVAPLPASTAGAVTFGCFNNAAKISASTIALWARTLDAVPGARLLLKTHGFNDSACRERFARLFAERGVGPERLVLEGSSPHPELLGAYGRVDVALDPMPYSGGLTTLEALWMGAPVVTLPGDSFASRHSASHLSNAGHPELVAKDADDYVRIAARLASDRDALAALRARLRADLAASPVCDGKAYARGLETAFRTMWRAWVAGEPPAPFDVPP